MSKKRCKIKMSYEMLANLLGLEPNSIRRVQDNYDHESIKIYCDDYNACKYKINEFDYIPEQTIEFNVNPKQTS